MTNPKLLFLIKLFLVTSDMDGEYLHTPTINMMKQILEQTRSLGRWKEHSSSSKENSLTKHKGSIKI